MGSGLMLIALALNADQAPAARTYNVVDAVPSVRRYTLPFGSAALGAPVPDVIVGPLLPNSMPLVAENRTFAP